MCETNNKYIQYKYAQRFLRIMNPTFLEDRHFRIADELRISMD
jgi:hypothetical protein